MKSIQEIINKNKFNLFKNVITIPLNLILKLSPLIIGIPLISMQSPSLFLLLQVIIVIFSTTYFLGNKYSIKKLINRKLIKELEEIVKDLIHKIENNKLQKEDIDNMIYFIINERKIKELFFIMTDSKYRKQEFSYLEKLIYDNPDNVNYENSIKEIMSENCLELNLNLLNISDEFIDRSINTEKIDFILNNNVTYELKKNDYDRIEYALKIGLKENLKLLEHLFKKENLVADWNYLKKKLMLLNNSNVDYMYNKLKEILNIRINDDRNFVKYEDSLDISKEKNEFDINNIVDKKEKLEKLEQRKMYNFEKNYNVEIFKTLKIKYEYLVNNNYKKDVELILDEVFPVINEYEKKLKQFKTQKIIYELMNNIDLILVEVNNELDKLIEKMEFNQLKDIKILAKYQSMKK